MPEHVQKQTPAKSSHDPSATIAPPSVPNVPDHVLLFRIGQGSYGEVWLARSVVGTLRAVKIVHRRTFERAEDFDREFKGLEKFEPLSRSHQGLVDILQIGRNDADGYFYYVMELADAVGTRSTASDPTRNIRDGVESAPTDPAGYVPRTLRAEQQSLGRQRVAECVSLGLALTKALEHLHQRGLVHRDIKPSSIIFVGGVPKLADIGLVADVAEAKSFVGTAGYIPPEGPGSPQADIYSLGKTLYELVTGKDRKDFPELPAELIQRTSRADCDDHKVESPPKALVEFNTILVKACENDFRKRYQTAQRMHDELLLLHQGCSVKSKRAAERRAAFARIVGAISVVMALLFAGLVLFSSRQSEMNRIRRQEAQQLFLEARGHANRLTKDEFSKAVELYHQAIAADPTYGPAYVGLAEAYDSVSGWHLRPKEAMAQAKWAITKALELDDKSASAHAWLGRIKKSYDWDWTGAEREFKRAITLAPRDALGYNCLATFYAWMGRFDEAEAELAQAQQLTKGPSHRDAYDAGMLLFFRRRYEEAIAQGLKALTLDTNSVLNHSLLMECYLKTERYTDAIVEAQILRKLDDAPYVVAYLGHVYAARGQGDEARGYLAKLEEYSGQRHVSPYFRGLIHLGLGEKQMALDCLEAAYEERFGWLGNLKVDPLWDELRSEPRFMRLLQRMGLEK